MSVKIKKITNKNLSSSITELNNIFSQFIDQEHTLDVDLIYPIILQMYQIFEDTCKILNCLLNSFTSTDDPLLSLEDILFFKNELETFCLNNPVTECIKKKNLTMEDIEKNNLYDEENKKIITKLYYIYKNSEYTNSMLEYLSRVHLYTKTFDDLNWINTIPGDYYEIFPFSSLNMKYLINVLRDSNDDNIEYFLYKLLKKLYDKSKKLYELVITPTIDINNLSNLLLDNMPTFRKEVDRCDKAFDKIESSLKTLKDNFDRYYKDYATTNDFSIIIQEFINDIYEDNKNDPILISQLRRIINHFSSKIKNHKNSNLKINNLVDKLNSIFNSCT